MATTTTAADSCFDIKIADRTFNVKVSVINGQKRMTISYYRMCVHCSVATCYLTGKRIYGTTGDEYIGYDVFFEKLTDLSANKLNPGIAFDFKFHENDEICQLSLIMIVKDPLNNTDYRSYEFTFSCYFTKDILAKRTEQLFDIVEKQSKEIARLTNEVAELKVVQK